MKNNKLIIYKIFSYIFFVLLFINIFIFISPVISEELYIKKIIDLFSFNCEANIPTLFICIILTFIIFELYLIMQKVKNNFVWKFLLIFFIYVLIDEFVQIHEIVALYLKINYPLSGIWNYEWVIIALPITFAIMIYLFFLLNSYSKRFKYQLLGGFSIIIIGEVLLEMAGGLYMYDKYINSFFAICEESLEIIGLIYIYYVLCEYDLEIIKNTKK